MILDSEVWTENLPSTIEAVLFPAGDDAAQAMARRWRHLLLEHFHLEASEVPQEGVEGWLLVGGQGRCGVRAVAPPQRYFLSHTLSHAAGVVPVPHTHTHTKHTCENPHHRPPLLSPSHSLPVWLPRSTACKSPRPAPPK